MSQMSSKESSSFSGRSLLLVVSAAAVLCLTLNSLYSLGVLSLELALTIAILPFLTWLFLFYREALLLTLVAAYFGAGYFSSSLITEGLIRSMFLLIMGLAVLLELGVRRVIRRVSTPLDKIIFIWLIIILFSFVYGFYFKHNETKYLIGDLYKFVEIFVVFWLTTLIVKNDRQVRFLVWGFLSLALVFGIVDSLIFFGRWFVGGDVLLARVRGAAQFSSMFALIVTVSLILHERRAMVRALLLFLSVGFLVSFLLSFLRTGYIVFPATVAFVIGLYLYKRKRYSLEGIMKLVIFALLLLMFVSLVNLILVSMYPGVDIIKGTLDRFSSLIDPAEADPMGVRMLEINSIISEVVARSPFLGNGLGGEYYSGTLVDGELQWGLKHFVHNNYFDFLVRTGIFGLVAFFIFAFIYLRNVIRFYVVSKGNFHQGVLLATAGIFVSSCLVGLSTSLIYSPFLFMMIALTYCATYLEEKSTLRKSKVE